MKLLVCGSQVFLRCVKPGASCQTKAFTTIFSWCVGFAKLRPVKNKVFCIYSFPEMLALKSKKIKESAFAPRSTTIDKKQKIFLKKIPPKIVNQIKIALAMSTFSLLKLLTPILILFCASWWLFALEHHCIVKL